MAQNFVDDQELNPLTYVKQFINPDSTIPQTPDGLLCHAQMVLATELRKDPFLKQAMQDLFKAEAQISVHPTKCGINKINEHHP